MSVVNAVLTPSYEEGAVYEAVSKHFEALEVERELAPGMKVLLKPNLLYGKKPEAGVTTNPAVIRAVIRWLTERGHTRIVVAESSGGLYTAEYMRGVYGASGLRTPGIEEYLNRDFTFKAVPTREGFHTRVFNLITPVTEADYIINLPKLKTHAMTTVSCGVKNLFGTIPGLQKPDMHRRYPNTGDFVHMLCELCETVKPSLTLLDAVDSMEGNGPGGGTVRHTGLTLCSRDVYALDVTAVRFMGLEPDDMPHLRAAREMCLLPEKIDVTGDGIRPCSPAFRLPDAVKSTGFDDAVPKLLRKPAEFVMDRLLRSYPHVDKSKCVGCGKCAESCPQKIIKITDKKAGMPRQNCISCFCCQEMCPVHAISVRRGLRGL